MKYTNNIKYIKKLVYCFSQDVGVMSFRAIPRQNTYLFSFNLSHTKDKYGIYERNTREFIKLLQNMEIKILHVLKKTFLSYIETNSIAFCAI